MRRKIIYVSGTRADYGLMSSSLKLWHNSEDLDVSVCVTGMHLLEEFGFTASEIENDGLNVCGRIPVDLSDGTGAAMARAIGYELIGMTDLFEGEKPDLVVILGDRGEMLAGALAAIHLNIPIVHIHGGERSGTVDEPVRHAISKLSHYHFTATDEARQRLIRMGENPKHVIEVGAPGLDGLKADAVQSRLELCEGVGFSTEKKISLLVFHPVVQEANQAGAQVKLILNVLGSLGLQVICLMPNADAGGLAIREEIEVFQKKEMEKSKFCAVTHLPRKIFVSWMKHADVMVGNSSSGIIEAATFNTPVVNIGKRQQGRERSKNLIDIGFDRLELQNAIEKILVSPYQNIENVYGDGCSGQRMLNLLCTLPLDKGVLNKLNAY